MSLPIKIQLPEAFFRREVRDGYEVSEKVKRIWAVQLDLLEELKRVCVKHKIEFQVCAGTLLGAVRHGGFIPWDDDFDVCMTRENINRLINLEGEFMYPYFLQTPLNDRRHTTLLIRLRNSETTAAITGCDTEDYNNGIYIDIFALDGLARSKWKCALQYLLKRLIVRLLIARGSSRPQRKSLREKVIYCILKPISIFLPYKLWYRLYLRVLSLWTGSTDRLAYLATMNWGGKSMWTEKREASETINMKFECTDVPVTKYYDSILSRQYGDYMKFPPVEERGRWHDGKIVFDPDTPYREFLQKKNRTSP